MLEDEMMKEKLWFELILFLRFHSCFYSMLLRREEIHFCLYILQKRKVVLVHAHPDIESVFYMNPCSEVSKGFSIK